MLLSITHSSGICPKPCDGNIGSRIRRFWAVGCRLSHSSASGDCFQAVEAGSGSIDSTASMVLGPKRHRWVTLLARTLAPAVQRRPLCCGVVDCCCSLTAMDHKLGLFGGFWSWKPLHPPMDHYDNRKIANRNRNVVEVSTWQLTLPPASRNRHYVEES